MTRRWLTGAIVVAIVVCLFAYLVHLVAHSWALGAIIALAAGGRAFVLRGL